MSSTFEKVNASEKYIYTPYPWHIEWKIRGGSLEKISASETGNIVHKYIQNGFMLFSEYCFSMEYTSGEQ